MSRKGDDSVSRPDDENPEWTREQLHQERPALEGIAETFGPEGAHVLRRGGRPVKPNRKVNWRGRTKIADGEFDHWCATRVVTLNTYMFNIAFVRDTSFHVGQVAGV
jgi:hypothetical protein